MFTLTDAEREGGIHYISMLRGIEIWVERDRQREGEMVEE